jgi:hypothetical protein
MKMFAKDEDGHYVRIFLGFTKRYWLVIGRYRTHARPR